MYLVRVIPQIPMWLEVLITFDRLVFVLKIKKLEFLQQKRVICLLLALIVFMLSALNFSNLEFFVTKTDTFENVTIEGSNQTSLVVSSTYLCTSYKEVVLMWDVIAITIRTIIPFILIVGANTKLVRALFESRKKFKRSESISNTKDAKHIANLRKEYSFLMSIVALDFFFVSVLIPLAVTLILLDFYAFIPSLATPTRVASARLAYYISFYVSSLPYAMGFVINLIFNRVFRSEILEIIVNVKASFSKLKSTTDSTII